MLFRTIVSVETSNESCKRGTVVFFLCIHQKPRYCIMAIQKWFKAVVHCFTWLGVSQQSPLFVFYAFCLTLANCFDEIDIVDINMVLLVVVLAQW